MYWYADKEEICFVCKEENEMHYNHYEKSYLIKDFKNWASLYNKTLDDFDAEYDDVIASGLEALCKQFWKEKDEICDSVTQE